MNVGDITPGSPSPFRIVRPRQEPSPDGRIQEHRPQTDARDGAAGAASTPSPRPPQVLTNEESEFFERAYPGSATEIRHRFSYTRSGETTGGATGTLIDRKG